MFTSKCASRKNDMHFFDISTSNSAPYPSVFCTFDLEMCFAPQLRALFPHLIFQKCSGHEMLCTVWLGNVFRATSACTLSTSQLLKVVLTCSVFNVLTSECDSRHNGVHFSISHLAKWLRTLSSLFLLFSSSPFHLHLHSSDLFSSLIFSLLLFSSLTLPTSAFPSVQIVGSLTSKLPSIMYRTSYLKLGQMWWEKCW